MPLWFVFALLAEGLVVAALAQGASRTLSGAGAIGFGLGGSFGAGVIAWLFIDAPVGLVFGAIGATALVYTRGRFVSYR